MDRTIIANKLFQLIKTSDSYGTVLGEMKKFIKHNTNLEVDSNHVVLYKNYFDKDDLAFLICEYAQFSNEAIHMLTDARIRNYDWKELADEINNNITEELGSMTKNIPHLEIMRRGYRKELGIETDDYKMSKTTETFLTTMRRIFKHDDNAYSAGALLAFEGTAIAEFYILDEIVKEYAVKADLNLLLKGDTKNYIDGHKFFEIGHEDGLKNTIEPFITPMNIKNFAKGYLAVVLAMSNWWEQLANNVMVRKLTHVTPYNGSK